MSLDNDRMIIENNQYIPNNYDKENMKSNLYIGDCIRELTNELKNINKNLEKIANKDFNVNTNNYTIPNSNKNEFISPYDYRNNVWCDTNINQNKDSYVDKNIISD